MSLPVFIQFETKTREFDSKLLLICHLLQSGFSEIYLGSKGGVQRESQFHARGIYIFKGLTRTAVDNYIELKKKGFKIILLHVEGGIHYRENKNSILSIFPPDLLKLVDINFVFGSAIKEAIVKYCGEEFYGNIIVSGEPRFDMLKTKYRPFFDTCIFLKRNYKDFILINTSFSAGNPIIGKGKIKDYWINEPTLTKEAKDSLVEKIAFQELLINDFIYAVIELSKSYTDRNFVVRPHPSESPTIYIESFQGYPNIYVSKTGNVAEWIFASSGVIHYDCTTGMEAVLAGKPVISYIPKENESTMAWLPVDLSLKVKDIIVLKDRVRNIFEGNFKHKLDDKVIDKWANFVNNVNNYSSEIIASELNKFNDFHNNEKQHLPIGLYYDRYLSFIKHLYRFFRMKCFYKNNAFNKLNKFENCKKEEVITKIHKLLVIENFRYKFKVYQIRPDVVLIKRSG